MLHETSSINHYQLRDRHDDQEHEQAVDPDFGPIYASQSCGYVRPTALPIASSMPKAQSTSRVSAKIRRLCKPTTSRIKAFMAFPCLRSQPVSRTSVASIKNPEPRTTKPA